MKITLSKEEKTDLYFILDEFVITHSDGDSDIYKNEIKIAKRIIKKL